MSRYIQKHAWSNTEASDLLDLLEEEYKKSDEERLMGDEFDFGSWTKDWLLTSGANTLEPYVQYDENGKIQFFSIK